MRRLAVVVFAMALLFLLSVHVPAAIEIEPAAMPSPPTSGEELWQSLPPELLANVAESKMEAIASYKSAIRRLEDELERVQEIQAEKLASRPPPPGG